MSDGNHEGGINLALNANQWKAFFIADRLDGSAAAVERWKCEVDRVTHQSCPSIPAIAGKRQKQAHSVETIHVRQSLPGNC
jgi:hypothetical protein